MTSIYLYSFLICFFYFINPVTAHSIEAVSAPLLSAIEITDPQEFDSDSMIFLSAELLPKLKSDEVYSSYFEISYRQADAFIRKNDFINAVASIRRMQQEAQVLDNKAGMAYASFAVGDFYLKKGMVFDANDAYEESWSLFSELSENRILTASLLQQLLHISFLKDDAKRMLLFLSELHARNLQTNSRILRLHTLYKLHYNLKKHNLQGAAELFQQSASFVNASPDDRTCCFLYYTAAAALYEQQARYRDAASYLNDSLAAVFPSLDYANQKYILQQRARVSLLLHEPGAMVADLDEIWRRHDSLGLLEYQRQVKDVREVYEANKIALKEITARTSYLYLIVIAIVVILIVVSLFFGVLYVKTRQLMRSKDQQLRMIEKAHHSIQTKNAFLSNMSHEIRSPMNAVVGFSALLCDETDDTAIAGYNKIINLNSALLLKLINDVIDLSHLNLGEIDFKMTQCDVVILANAVIESVRASAGADVTLRLSAPFTSCIVNTDESRLQQVLINLLVNALKFTTSGSVTLAIGYEEEGSLLFSVTDTGCGVPAEKQPLLFSRFGKLQDNVKGFGLGLSICQLIISQLGGEIWYDSEYIQGARFVFTHPAMLQAKEPVIAQSLP